MLTGPGRSRDQSTRDQSTRAGSGLPVSSSIRSSATLADAAMGLSVRSALEPGRRHVTIELGVHYLRAIKTGTVTATGRAVRIGREVAYAEAAVTDERGTDLARASGTYSVTAPRDQ